MVISIAGKLEKRNVEMNRECNIEDNTLCHDTGCHTWALPDWTPASPEPPHEPLEDAEREAIIWADNLSDDEGEAVVRAVGDEFAVLVEADRPSRFEPLMTRQQALERMAQTKREILSEWVEYETADGRHGLRRPGQPVASRWWEHTAFEDLTAW